VLGVFGVVVQREMYAFCYKCRSIFYWMDEIEIYQLTGRQKCFLYPYQGLLVV
jgi:hypothetical protein